MNIIKLAAIGFLLITPVMAHAQSHQSQESKFVGLSRRVTP